MKALDMYIYCGRAVMLGNKKVIDLFENSPELATAMCAAEWNKPNRKIVNPRARIRIQCYGGGDSGSVDQVSVNYDNDEPEHDCKYILCGEWGIYEGEQHKSLYSLLMCQEYDWWNNDGGAVTIIINPETGMVEKDYQINITTQEGHASTSAIDLPEQLSSVQEIGLFRE